jgi:hypothetical protein
VLLENVFKTLVDEIKFGGKLTGVRDRSSYYAIANDYFKLDEIPKLDIIIDDAFEFVLKTSENMI